MTVFDNKDNFTRIETQIVTGYLLDVPYDETYQVLSSYSPSQNHAF